MANFLKKRKFQYMLYSKPVLALLGLVVLFFLYSVYGAYGKVQETNTIKEQRAAVLSELEVREEVLQQEIDRLSTPKGLEEEIRSKFEVAKEGEEVIVIVEAPEEENTGEQEEESGFFERLFGG